MEFETIELTKDVLIFKNVLKDIEKVQEFIKKTKEEDYVDPFFGVWTNYIPNVYYYKMEPELQKEYEISNEYSAEFVRECREILYKCIKIYKENYFDKSYFEKYNWDMNIPISVEELKQSRYYRQADFLILENVNTPSGKKLSMDYHQDRRFWLGGIHCVFNFNIYLNDDYSGGEIIFIDIDNAEESTYIDKNGEIQKYYLIDKPIKYKMQAGDGMLFRTDRYHAVNPVSGKKYYVRQFLLHKMPQEFYDKEASFENKEDWFQFLKEKEKKGFSEQVSMMLYNSIDDIDLHEEQYKEWSGVLMPCVIKDNA